MNNNKNIFFSGLLTALFFITSCSNSVSTPTIIDNNSVKTLSDDVLDGFLKDSFSRLFIDLDDNNDKKLSKNEVENAIWEEKFKSLDKNNDGFLSLNEITSNKSSLIANEFEMRKRAKDKFSKVDLNKDLFVDFQELSTFYKKDVNESDENKNKIILSIFQSVDYGAISGNKDNKINFDEFENFLYIFPASSSSVITKKFPDIFS